MTLQAAAKVSSIENSCILWVLDLVRKLVFASRGGGTTARIAVVSLLFGLAATNQSTAGDILNLQNCHKDYILKYIIAPGVNRVDLIDPKATPPVSDLDRSRGQWAIEPLANGEVRIINREIGTDNVLTRLKRSNGEDVLATMGRDGSKYQLWRLVKIDSINNIYVIMSSVDGKVLDAKSGGTKMILWNRHDSTNQQWRLVKVGQF